VEVCSSPPVANSAICKAPQVLKSREQKGFKAGKKNNKPNKNKRGRKNRKNKKF
jgi:hypothetical protein